MNDEKKEVHLENYLMLPQQIERIGKVYPIKLLDYEDFMELFRRYMLYDIKSINRLRKQEYLPKVPETNLFDYLIGIIEKEEYLTLQKELDRFKDLPRPLLEMSLKDAENKEEILNFYDAAKNLNISSDADNLCKLFKMTLKQDVVYNKYAHVFFIYNKKGEKVGVIDSKNFQQYRDKVMEQNIIFEPKIMPSKKAQEIINKEMNRGAGEYDIEAIMALVSVHTGKDLRNYTYYRLIADFNCIVREISYSELSNYNANGCTDKSGKPLSVPSLTENLGILNNPYNKILRKSTETDFDRALKGR